MAYSPDPEPNPDHAKTLSDADIARQSVAFARRLGPESELLVTNRTHRIRIVDLCRGGRDVSDAVLTVVHGAMADDAGLEDEFSRRIFGGMTEPSGADVDESPLTSDAESVAISVWRCVWPDLTKLVFRTEGQFVALLRERMNWKRLDRLRRALTVKRSEHRRSDRTPDELETELTDGTQEDPADVAARAEDLEMLKVALHALPEPRRRVLELHYLKGIGLAELARATGKTYDGARMARDRARNQLRETYERMRALGDTSARN